MKYAPAAAATKPPMIAILAPDPDFPDFEDDADLAFLFAM